MADNLALPPRWLFKILRNKVYPVHEKQSVYPILFTLSRLTYLVVRAYNHLRFMDFSVLPGRTGYYLWKFGIIRFWQRFFIKRYTMPKSKDNLADNLIVENINSSK